MKIFLGCLILFISGCIQSPDPPVSYFEDAPASIRKAVRFDFSNPDHPIEHYALRRRVPPTDWIDLGGIFQTDGVFVQGSFAYDDSGAFETIQRLRVDTGSNSVLSIALTHDLSRRMWVSKEYGERSSSVLRGKNRAWRGVGTALSIEGVLLSPVPVEISEVVEETLLDTPLLGQEWFGLTEATWIDAQAGLLAVSFRRQAVDSFLADNPEGWISLPWRAVRPDGHRFITVEVAGSFYEAVIDTGMDRELFLDVSHPPSFVRRPWQRSQVVTPIGAVGPVYLAISNEPLRLADFEVAEPVAMWFGTRSTTHPKTPEDRPFGILGLDFLRRYPTLLDPKRHRAHFFVGDRASLRPPGGGFEASSAD